MAPRINVLWDAEAKVWVASSDDLPGLNTEAKNREELHRKICIMIPELLADDDDDGRILYSVQEVAAA